MSEERQLVHVQTPQEVPQRYVHAQPPAAPAGNPLVAVHGALRGRYLWAIPIALILALSGALIGYRVMPPKYQSVGLIRIRASLPSLFQKEGQSGVLPMFDAFVQSQVEYIQSRRVIDKAMQNPDWQKIGRGLSPQAVANFMQSLQVEHPKSSEIIRVVFTDNDPDPAAAGARAVVDAYQKLFIEDDVDGARRMQLLEDRKTTLGQQLKSITDRIQAIGKPYGTDKLDRIFDYNLQDQQRAESELKTVELALAQAEGRQKSSPTTAPSDMSIEAIIATDPRCQEAWKARLAADRHLKLARVRYGARHPQALDAEAALQIAEDDLQQMIGEYRAARKAGVQPNPVRPQELQFASVPQLQAQQASLKSFLDKLKADTIKLGAAIFEIENLRTEAESVRQKLTETNNAIEQKNIESLLSGRLDIMSRGDRPEIPSTDRRMAVAAAGAVGGIALTLGVFLLIGFIDRRFRYVAEAKNTGLRRSCRVLGVVPRLPADPSDQGELEIVAHCVHHIRTLLQIHSRVSGQRIFAVTSPSPGDGKTSLTTALGLSAAASGCRVLLIDCDVVGGGLTARMGSMSRRALGDMLCRAELLTEQQLAEGWHQALRRGSTLSDALIAMGAIAQADIDRVLAEPNGHAPGLLNAVAGANWTRCVMEAAAPGALIMPIGSLSPGQTGQLSPDAIDRVLEQVRPAFDLILIDTGPVLGTPEATVVAAEADGVLMMISRGEQRPVAERAIEQLQSVGADVVGIVFNRARLSDLESSGYSSGMSARSARVSSGGAVDVQQRAKYAAAGPVVGAVASAVWNDKGENGSR